MRIGQPGKFERMRRDEGLKNEADIWDLDTLDQIREEIEQESVHVHTLVEASDREQLSKEGLEALKRSEQFARELSVKIQEAFSELIDTYQRPDGRKIRKEIVEYVRSKGLLLPTFTLAAGESAKRLIDELGVLNHEQLKQSAHDDSAHDDGEQENESKHIDAFQLHPDEALLVFQLPKPLARFWNKGGQQDWGGGAQDVGDSIIEWGHFYRQLMHTVWEATNHVGWLNEGGLGLERVNQVAQHDPKAYYYIWRTFVPEHERVTRRNAQPRP